MMAADSGDKAGQAGRDNEAFEADTQDTVAFAESSPGPPPLSDEVDSSPAAREDSSSPTSRKNSSSLGSRKNSSSLASRKNSSSLASRKDSSSLASRKNSSSLASRKDSSSPVAEEEERVKWGNPIEFLLSCIAMSVGLGNFWRFPTTAYENGGGAFLIPYLLVLFFIGRPLYFLELSLGQFSSQSMVHFWNAVPAFKGVGFAQAIASSSVVSYYSSIIALAIWYLVMSFSSVLPWSVCDEAWANLDTCIEVSPSASPNATNVTSNATLEISALQYFRDFLLQEPADLENGPGAPDWRLSICLLLSWTIVGACLIRGVKSSGKAAYVMALFPYVGLFTLLGKGVTLPGAHDGIMQFITPRWEKIGEAKVWYNAVTQSFFSLSVGFGPVIMYSSHNEFRHNIYRDSLIISLMDTVTSLLAGFTIFSILGYLQHVTNTENFDDIVAGGTSLVFVAYPTAIASFETVPQLFSVIFFLVLLTLGIGSAMALASAAISVVQDLDVVVERVHPAIRRALRRTCASNVEPPTVITVVLLVAFFLVSLVFVTPGGQWVLDLVDFFGGGFIIYILTTVECAGLMWIYTYSQYRKDVFFMINEKLGLYWHFCLRFLVPFALTALFIYFLVNFEMPTYNDGMQYPTIALVFGWLLFAVSMAMLPLGLYLAYRATAGAAAASSSSSDRLKSTFEPNDKHGPAMADNRQAWQTYKKQDGFEKLNNFKKITREATASSKNFEKFLAGYEALRDRDAWEALEDKEEGEPRALESLLCCCGP